MTRRKVYMFSTDATIIGYLDQQYFQKNVLEAASWIWGYGTHGYEGPTAYICVHLVLRFFF